MTVDPRTVAAQHADGNHWDCDTKDCPIAKKMIEDIFNGVDVGPEPPMW